MVDLSQYTTEELESMLGEEGGQPAPAAPAQSASPMIRDEDAPLRYPGRAGDVAAALRGVRESLPLGQDIGAMGTYLFGNPLTGQKAPESFSEAKRQQIAKDEALYQEHPLSYAGGFGAGLGTQMMYGAPAASMALETKIAQKAAPYVGEAAGRLAGVAGTGAATGAVYGAGQGVTPEERITGAGKGALFGAGTGALAEGATKLAQKTGLIGRGAPPVPVEATKDTLEDIAKGHYKATESAGLSIKREPLQKFYNDLVKDLIDKQKYRANIHTELKPAIGELHNLAKPPMSPDVPYKFVTLNDLDTVNQFANRSLKSPDKQTRRMGMIFKDRLEDFIQNLKPENIMAGDKKLAIDSLNLARDYWGRARKMEELQHVLDTSHLISQRPGSTRSASDVARTKINKWLQDVKTGKVPKRRWTDDELRALNDIAKSNDLLERIGAFDPTKSRGSALTALITAIHSPGLAVAGGLTTGGIRRYLEHQTQQKLDYLQNLIAAGGKHHLVAPGKKPSVASKGATLRQTVTPFGSVQFAPSEESMTDEYDREERAFGGKVGKRDYPAKRLNKVERALKKAQEALALETKPLMDRPDEQIAQALRIAKGE